MKKAKPETIESHLVPIEEEELARVIPIRTETTLTRYPIHRIAKKGEIKIKQTKQNERGKAITTWEVKNPPGPLAYKLDTIIINRRIDEMRNRGEIKKLIKLGSLRDICHELGINPNGKATNSIKEALKENAFAGITARLDYKSGDGLERTFEFATTRYTVIFTGEKLPSEKRADAVYIELHPRYHEMLNYAKTRPLDYKYLRELPPSAQRLYELLSFVMFGVIKHGRPNAQMTYSEFCQSAPLTRHEEWDKVRPQMWKIHKPHIDSGYIKSVEFEETTDKAGLIDWVMRYTPGRKAKHEFKHFTTKRIDQKPEQMRLALAPPVQSKKQNDAPTISEEDAALLSQLCEIGIVEKKAFELVRSQRESVERELEAWPHRDKSKMKDPAAWLIRAIESGDYSLPQKTESKRAQKTAAQKQAARDAIREQFAGEYRAYLSGELETLQAENEQAHEAFSQEFAQFWDLACRNLGEEHRGMMRLNFFEKFAGDHPSLEIHTFWQWAEVEKPTEMRGL